MSFIFSYPTALPNGGYNELLEESGELRPHWKSFFKAVEETGKDKFISYGEQVSRLMSADLFSLNSKQEKTHGVIPFILPEEEFEIISQGLIQRAELFNKILADLYGEQTLISEGILPAQVLFGNSSYLPALKNAKPVNNIFIQEYAADLERAPDGKFWVVNDKTQIPEGVGLAIKHRMTLSRVMPEIYKKAAPCRIFDFFEALRTHLFSSALTQDNTKIPVIVMLSNSVKKGLSFEEAFFARSLGIIAVDPADLTVRDSHVYLKNIDGLKQVDVILRRIEDSLCDTLELNGSSLFGVAGLVEVVRKNNVAIVNPLGTGLAEIPALKAFIHNICHFFNQEDLLLPSVATWWCGQEKEKEYVINNLDKLKLYNASTGKKVFVSSEEIEKNPTQFVAQEKIVGSMTPVLQYDTLKPARVRMRFHLIYENGSYKVLKGGIAFTKSKTPSLRDIWIPTTNKAEKTQASLVNLKTTLTTKPLRTTFELTSRIAENMFWLGRNLERSEELARILRVTISRATEGLEIPEPNDIATLFSILALAGHLEFKDYQNPIIQAEALTHLRSIISSPDYGFGLHFLFTRLKEMADLLQDRLSMDTWEIFSELSSLLPEENANYQVYLNRLKNIVLRQSALSGLIREDMTRDHSWRFMEIGRELERAMQILTLLSGIDFCAGNGFNASLETLLETSDCRMTYRVRYMAVPSVPLVLDLLICDNTNPRSFLYQIERLKDNVSVLEKESRQFGLFSKELFLLRDIIAQIKEVNVMTLAEQTYSINETVNVNAGLNTLINELRRLLKAFSDTLTLSSFVLSDATRQGPTYLSKEEA